ncbi:MAG: hypothetical protein LUG50_14620, partial [Planctomycetaceae bacterium]|nr:hypothetical protein [Planctomycetaceae bacterium]
AGAEPAGRAKGQANCPEGVVVDGRGEITEAMAAAPARNGTVRRRGGTSAGPPAPENARNHEARTDTRAITRCTSSLHIAPP